MRIECASGDHADGSIRRAWAQRRLPASLQGPVIVTRAVGFLLLVVLTNATLLLLLPFTATRFLVTAVLYAAGTAAMLVILFHPRNRWFLDPRTDVQSRGRPSVALTFDDGPSPDVTVRVLDILRQKNAKATFFVVGRQVERHPELARRAVAEGHVVANHTYSHPPLFCFLSPRRLREEIERTQDVIHGIAGVRPRHFRSPVGLRHPLLKEALERANLELVLWRLRTYDTWPTTRDQLHRRILGRVRPGAIVLLHDRPGPGTEAMVAALPDVIDALRHRGYELVTV
jgi:peptidoglycan/xylan/chitin deacetylase (PgdA/CDA1 family)